MNAKEKAIMETLNKFCIDRYGKNWKDCVSLYVVKESFRKLGQRKYIEQAIDITIKEVFDDIELHSHNQDETKYMGIKDYNKLKKRHFSTFSKKEKAT